ncbi:MAG TPA: MAPEG family protein [Kofleriaceae bacterium]|nr:MAPEG family protein [Kofleriaceae bacterium]
MIVLALWTHLMWLWMYVTRIPAIRQAGMRLDPGMPRGEQMAQLPARVRWKADNYNHLMEQPTVFYAVAIVYSLLSIGSGWPLRFAWLYVGLRVVHSLVQATWNKIEVRFVLFVLSSLVLIVMTVRALVLIVQIMRAT